MDGPFLSSHPFGSLDTTVHAWQMNGPWLENMDDKGGLQSTYLFKGGIVIGAERSVNHQYGADNLGPAAIISEIVVYDSELTEPDRWAVQSYLVDKYIVPDPATIMLLGLGGLALIRKRR